MGSLPAWECGLKSKENQWVYGAIFVTPCVRVWIEIFDKSNYTHYNVVTPCVGVWIEIGTMIEKPHSFSSLPAWECGLK